MDLCIYKYTYLYIYTYKYTYTNMCACVHTHTHTNVLVAKTWKVKKKNSYAIVERFFFPVSNVSFE